MSGEGGGAGAGVLPELSEDHRTLLGRFDARERTALARAISVVEDGRTGFQPLLHALVSRGRSSPRLGVTGPPGAGKSTLVDALARRYREAEEEVGVVAVDPTSPFTGGALLGDRIRMSELATDPGVFIRSMATRGSLGGLAVTTKEVLDVMEAYGFGRLLVETVGVGQAELDIAGEADTVVVVLVPESGDAVQAMKAGLTEIADVFVVNKADRPGAERLARELGVMLQMRAGETLRDVPAHHGVDLSRAKEGAEVESGGEIEGDGEGHDGPDEGPGGSGAGGENGGDGGSPGAGGKEDDASREGGGAAGSDVEPWEIPVLQTTASTGEGVGELVDAVAAHGRWLRESGELERRRRRRVEARIREVVERELRRRAWDRGPGGEILREELGAVAAGERTPYEVAAEILRAMERG